MIRVDMVVHGSGAWNVCDAWLWLAYGLQSMPVAAYWAWRLHVRRLVIFRL
jgi:hypothetical protein